ncbi:MAG: hypothetical protein J6A17_05045 [Bacilli bacterium]|nr:hypothetical protein [Bacilli bacterium]
MKILKKNYKFILGIIVGLIIAGTGVYAATILTSNQVSYDNTNSKLSSTNVKDALDELSTKAENTNSKDNIVIAYTYDESTCVTGDETTCKVTKCYKDKTANSCPAGTIIKYRVNSSEMKVFYVIHDNGATMTMQQRENIIYNTPWYETEQTYTKGPLTVLTELENITSSWTNVNLINYTMGTTVFYNNKYTGCSVYNSCTSNTYTMTSRSARARMITLQEALAVGCTETNKSCPIWMYNYMIGSIEYGGTSDGNVIEDPSNFGYWTMNTDTSGNSIAFGIHSAGRILGNFTYHGNFGARAVVVISK